MGFVITLVMVAAAVLGAALAMSRRKGPDAARSGASPVERRSRLLTPARDTPFAPRIHTAEEADTGDLRRLALAVGLVLLASLAGAQAQTLLQLYVGYEAGGRGGATMPYTLLPLLLAAAAIVFAIDGRGLSVGRVLAVATGLAALGLYVAQRQALDPGLPIQLMILNGAAFAAQPLAIAWLARQGLANPLCLGLVAASHSAGFALRINLLGSLGGEAGPGLLLLIAAAFALGLIAWRSGGEEGPDGYDAGLGGDPIGATQLAPLVALLILATFGLRFASYAAVDQFALSEAGMGHTDAALTNFLAVAGALAGGFLASRGVKLAAFVSLICLAAAALLVVSAVIDGGRLKLLIVMLMPGLGAMTLAPLYAAFQNRAGPGGRMLAAAAPVALVSIIGIFVSAFAPRGGLAFLLSAICLAAATVIGLGGPAAVRAMIR